MCSINHDKKAIFIHIPKTGGSYVADILEKHYGFKKYYLQRPDHTQFCMGKDKSVKMHENKIHGTLMYYQTSPYINKIMKMNQEKWNSYFIFTFVRNPYDKIVSGWNYCNKYNIEFKDYINIDFNTNDYDYWHVFMPQIRHVIGTKGKNRADFIGYYEDLEQHLRVALQKIKIENITHQPYLKNEKKHANYKEYYIAPEIIEKVKYLLKEDFDNLEYSSSDL